MNSKKWMAWLLCWTGALALAQTTGGAIETSAGRIEVLGQNFQALAPIGPSQTRIVVYSLPDNRLPGATSIFVNGAYHASLIKGAYSDLCYSPGAAEIGARQTEVGQRPKDQPDTITALSLQGARTYFLRVREQSGRPLLQPVAAEQALQELPKERLQQHTISRVAQDCITTAGVEPVQNEPAARHTLQSDTLFAFGRSDRAGLTVAGFSSIDQLMARLRADYTYTVTATLVDLAGNRVNPAAGGIATKTITVAHSANPVDPNANKTVTISAISDDTGVSNTDFYTADTTLTYSGTVSAGFNTSTGAIKVELLDNTGINTLLANASGVTYTPSANYNGNDTLTMTTSDGGNSGTGGALSDTDTVAINVTAVNDAPVGVNDTATAQEAGGVANGTAGTNPAGNVISNDTDVDNATNTLTVQDIKAGSGSATAVTAGTTSANGLSLAGAYGTIVIGADGSYTYTVDNANATVQALNTGSTALSDVFTYTVKDPSGATSTATLTVAVNGANDAPVVANALADTTGTAGVAFSYTVASNAFTDVDNASLTYSATLADGSALPSWLTFDATTRTFSGTPTAGTAGTTVSVKVTASDGSLSANDTYDIVIGSANHAPTVTQTTATADPLGAASYTYATSSGVITGTVTSTPSTFTVGGVATTVSVSGGDGAINSRNDKFLGGVSKSGMYLYAGAADETANFTFATPLTSIKIEVAAIDNENFMGATYTEYVRLTINGQSYAIKPSQVVMQAYSSPYATVTPVIDGTGGLTAAYADYAVNPTLVSASAVITINAADVPGGVINSLSYTNDVTSGNDAGGTGVILNLASGPAATASATVQTLFGGYYADSDSDLMRGVMVTSASGSATQTAQGKYQYSTNGGTTWVDISAASVSDSSALYLAKTDLVRFVPAAGNTTGVKPDLTVRVVDSFSGNGPYTSGSSYDATGANSGGSTSISGGTFTLESPLKNHAPVLADTALALASVSDTADGVVPTGAVGSLVSSLVGGVTDADTANAKGIAITGVDTTQGTLYYSTNGGTTWTAVGAVSNTSALLLGSDADNRVYFVPAAGTAGGTTVASAFTFRAWDQTTGTEGTKVNVSVNGSDSAFSVATDVVAQTVTVADAWLQSTTNSYAISDNGVLTLLDNHAPLDLSKVTGANALTEVNASADASANVVKLSLADLLAQPAGANHQLKLTGDSNDTVALDLANWTNTGTTVTENGHTYAVYNANALSSEQLLIDQHMLVTQHS